MEGSQNAQRFLLYYNNLARISTSDKNAHSAGLGGRIVLKFHVDDGTVLVRQHTNFQVNLTLDAREICSWTCSKGYQRLGQCGQNYSVGWHGLDTQLSKALTFLAWGWALLSRSVQVIVMGSDTVSGYFHSLPCKAGMRTNSKCAPWAMKQTKAVKLVEDESSFDIVVSCYVCHSIVWMYASVSISMWVNGVNIILQYSTLCNHCIVRRLKGILNLFLSGL